MNAPNSNYGGAIDVLANEPTIRDLAPSLAEIGAHFLLMAADFERIAKEATTLAVTVQALQAVGEVIPARLYTEMESISHLFCEGGTASYDTDPIGRKCTDLWALVAVLSGKLVYRNGSLESSELDKK